MDGMILPFAMGACQAVGGNVITDAFGIVAMVANTIDHHTDPGCDL